MDLARDHRPRYPPLWPHHHDARFGWPAIPASDRRGLDRDGHVRPPDHHDCLQTPRTLGLVRLMVLPGVLDGAPRRRIAARQRSRPPVRVHRTVACGSAPARARILPAKGSTGIHDPVKVPTAANFGELRQCEVRRILLPRTPVKRVAREFSPYYRPVLRAFQARAVLPCAAWKAPKGRQPRRCRPQLLEELLSPVHASPSLKPLRHEG